MKFQDPNMHGYKAVGSIKSVAYAQAESNMLPQPFQEKLGP